MHGGTEERNRTSEPPIASNKEVPFFTWRLCLDRETKATEVHELISSNIGHTGCQDSHTFPTQEEPGNVWRQPRGTKVHTQSWSRDCTYLADADGSYGGQVAAADCDDLGEGVHHVDPLGRSQGRARLRQVRANDRAILCFGGRKITHEHARRTGQNHSEEEQGDSQDGSTGALH